MEKCRFRGLRPGIPIETGHAFRSKAAARSALIPLSRYTHLVAISDRRLIAAATRRHLPLEGLPDRGPGRYQSMKWSTGQFIRRS
jgi:hypothetical protein